MIDARLLALAGLAVAAGGAGLAIGLLAGWPFLGWPRAFLALHAAVALFWLGALLWSAWLLGRLDGEETAGAVRRRAQASVALQAALGVGLLVLSGRLALAPEAAAVDPVWPLDVRPTTFVKPLAPYTASSVARGLSLYREHCLVCHGPAGRGNPVAAASLGVTPADLASPHTRLHTPGDLFWWITNGIRPADGSGLAVCETSRTQVPGAPPVIRSDLSMPAFGARIPERARWDLVNAVRFLGDVVAADALGPAPAAEGIPRAPAFGPVPGRAALVAILPPGVGEARRATLERAAPALREAGVDVTLPADVDTTAVYARLGGAASGPVELLVDARGFVRARWRPGETPSWDEPERLVAIARDPTMTRWTGRSPE